MSGEPVPASTRWFTREHLWVVVDGEVRIGLTAAALDGMGELTFLDLPAEGERIVAGQAFGVIGSTKSEADLVAPVTGSVTRRNGAAVADPLGSATAAPGDGLWLLTVAPVGEAWSPQDAGLLDEAAYSAHVGTGR